MANYEEFLKEFICPECHVAILEPYRDFIFKCPVCGYCKEIKKNVRRETSTIIGGTKKPKS